MYNRYIPQSDGSYHRRSMPDQRQARQPWKPPPAPPEPSPCQVLPPPPPPNPPRTEHRPPPPRAGNFLRSLLPTDLDTEDLLVILLLLLMTGDGREGSHLPLLTLALYLFL